MFEGISNAVSAFFSQRLVGILVESFPKMLLPGLKMTIPLTGATENHSQAGAYASGDSRQGSYLRCFRFDGGQ